jgi:hypothetical protein
MEMITVTFDEKGNPSVDVQGMTGQSCQAVTKAVEDALGLVNKQTDLKPEAMFSVNTPVKRLTNAG